MKILVCYDSTFSTNEKIAQKIGQELGKTYDTIIRHIQKIKPLELIKENPDVLIIGGPIRMGNLSLALKSWIHSIGVKLETKKNKIKYVGFFCTHIMDREYKEKWMDLYNAHPFAEKIFPEFLSLRVKEMQGPLLESENPKIDSFLEKFKIILQ